MFIFSDLHVKNVFMHFVILQETLVPVSLVLKVLLEESNRLAHLEDSCEVAITILALF